LTKVGCSCQIPIATTLCQIGFFVIPHCLIEIHSTGMAYETVYKTKRVWLSFECRLLYCCILWGWNK